MSAAPQERTSKTPSVLDLHEARQRNHGSGGWRVDAGRLTVIYDHPDNLDATVTRVVAEQIGTGLREIDPATGPTVGLEYQRARTSLPADLPDMLPPPRIGVAA